MKKIMILALAFCCSLCTTTMTSNAQALKPDRGIVISKDTASNTSNVTVTLTAVPGKLKGLQVTVTKLTGTMAGGVTLQGTIDGTEWVTIGTNDTLIVTGTTASKLWTLTSTNYYSYRALYRSSGTQTSVIKFSYLRRPDE